MTLLRGTERLAAALSLIAVIGLSFLYGLAPDGFGMFVIMSACMGVLAIACFVWPTALLYFILTTSVFSSILRNADSVTLLGTAVSLSGLRWIWICAIAIVVLLRNICEVKLKGPFFWLLVFSAWVIVRWIATPTGIGLRDVLFYLLPGTLAVYAAFLLSKYSNQVLENTRRILLWTALAPPLAYAILIPLGLVTFMENMGPEGLVDPRTVSEYSLIILCLGASQWHYARTRTSRAYALGISLLCLGTCLLTLSRAATVTGVIVLGAARSDLWHFRKFLLASVTAIVLVGGILAVVPSLRVRFTGPDEALSEDFPYINTEGRAFFWAVTAGHAIEKPVVGWGPGSARLLVGAAIPDSEYEEYHPHNDYLQVFHDLGLVGLALVLIGWIPLVRAHWRRWRISDSLGHDRAAEWNLAAFLALLVVLLNSLVGNTLHETFVAAPALIISACAFAASPQRDVSGKISGSSPC